MRGIPTPVTLLGVLSLWGCGEITFPEFGEERAFSTHREVDVRFEHAGDTLSGTILFPREGASHVGMVLQFGSGAWSRGTFQELGALVTTLGLAVLTYDKRGVGKSQGTCCPENFPLLAGDLGAAAKAMAAHPRVDARRIGLFGSSQGSWVAPLAANEPGAGVAFAVLTVGGVVSVGEQNRYAELTGFDKCIDSGRSRAEAESLVVRAGRSGFDPEGHLRALAVPALWMFGENDLSTPTTLSVARLDSLRAEGDKDWNILVFPDANHNLIPGGSICGTEGQRADVLTPLAAWLGRVAPRP